MSELKPCPFCDCTTIDIILPNYEMQDYSAKPIASCNNCGAKSDLEKWNTRAPQDEWVSVNDDLPKSIKPVLVSLNGQTILMSRYHPDNKSWVDFGKFITHWMPLPTCPKDIK